MEYNKILELTVLKFLRVRIGQQFTPNELFTEVNKIYPSSEASFQILLKILQKEELIEMVSSSDDTNEIPNIAGITKEGLKLLRESKQ